MIYYEATKDTWDAKIHEHEALSETQCFIQTERFRIKKDSSYSKLFKTKVEAIDFKILCLKEEIASLK